MFRIPTFRQSFRLPAVLTVRERVLLLTGVGLCIGGIILAVASWYFRATELRPAVGGTYVEGVVGEPRYVNPLFASANDVDRDLVGLLYAGLFRVDEHGAVVPDIAERYAITDDQKAITVTLRPNVRWHDGAELDADDILFTVRLIQDPNVGSPLRAAFRGVTAERIDAQTVRFTTEHPFAVFLSALTIGILPEHLWTDIPPTHLALADLNLRPIGAGPFRFVGLTKGKRGEIRSYTIERYEGFHRGAPFIGRIIFQTFPDLPQLLAAFNNREVDGFGTAGSVTSDMITRRDATRHNVAFPSTTAVFLNARRNDALRDAAVRRALDRAVDRRAIITDVFRGTGTPTGGPLIPGFSPEADPPAAADTDVGAAATALDQTKWQRVTIDVFIANQTRAALKELEDEKKKSIAASVPKGKKAPAVPPLTDVERSEVEQRVRAAVGGACDGCAPQPYYRMRNGVSLAIALTTPDFPEFVATAERLRDAWRSIGIQTTIQALPIERVRGDSIPTRAYDALLFSQILGPDPDPFPFWHSSQVRNPGLNLTYFSNKAIDKLLEDARGTLDHAVRAQKYAAFQRQLAEERPAIFLFTQTFTYVVANPIHGVRLEQITQASDRFATVTEWYTTTKRTRK